MRTPEPEPLPTFRDNKDRAVYLLAEFKIPITIVFLAAGVWVAWWRPELPTPPAEARYFALSWGLLIFPAWLFGWGIVKWVYNPRTVDVAVAETTVEGDTKTENYTVWEVPPDVWSQVKVEGPQPLKPDEGADFVVTSWDWFEDTGTLKVRGCERADMTPGEQLANAQKVDEYYKHHHSLRRRFSQLKATVQNRISEIHDLTLMQAIKERENAEMSLSESITDVITSMEKDIDKMPTEGNAVDADLELIEPLEDDYTTAMTVTNGTAATDGGQDSEQ